jgi:hypothetical protein
MLESRDCTAHLIAFIHSPFSLTFPLSPSLRLPLEASEFEWKYEVRKDYLYRALHVSLKDRLATVEENDS